MNCLEDQADVCKQGRVPDRSESLSVRPDKGFVGFEVDIPG